MTKKGKAAQGKKQDTSENEAKKLVKKVSKMPCAITKFNCAPDTYTTNDGRPLKLEFKWGTHLTGEETGWVVNLFERNMREMYNMSKDGYDPVQKSQELLATTSRYIIVLDPAGGANGEGEKIAYCHYRIVIDYGIPVVYCYELQLEPEYQKQGVGTIILGILEKLSSRAGLTKVMATVFAFNGNSLSFFHKNGYTDDATSPTVEDDMDYLILSKVTPPEES
uniref:N-alpha-acetyltransferase 40 n=1 Tax=Steinernema glaseri TaxID=37863 RepID=A0A1I8ALX9_9BILA